VPSTQILVVEDHPLLASAIVELLESTPGMKVLGVARTGAEALTLAQQDTITVMLINYRLPDMSGAAAAHAVRAAVPDTAIVFHTADASETAILDAIDAGAGAFLTRTATADQYVEAVRRAALGEVLIPVELFARAISRQSRLAAEQGSRDRMLAEFTPRELDVLRALARGLDTPAIADQLGIALHTVEWHLRHVIEKLRVHSKLQAVVAAARLGIIDL
jgi:two-component system, NarL family, nitrate/nitrite response regulator NarL